MFLLFVRECNCAGHFARKESKVGRVAHQRNSVSTGNKQEKPLALVAKSF